MHNEDVGDNEYVKSKQKNIQQGYNTGRKHNATASEAKNHLLSHDSQIIELQTITKRASNCELIFHQKMLQSKSNECAKSSKLCNELRQTAM